MDFQVFQIFKVLKIFKMLKVIKVFKMSQNESSGLHSDDLGALNPTIRSTFSIRLECEKSFPLSVQHAAFHSALLPLQPKQFELEAFHMLSQAGLA